MKKFIPEFFKRGLIAAGGGPVILAIIYYVLGKTGTVTSLTPDEVFFGILTISLLAFIAGGSTAIYQIEQLPLFAAILIHGIMLYATYITIYLINGWLKTQWNAILIFTAAFIIGYVIIWLIIYLITKRTTREINQSL